jgi:hypothetical protein
VDINSQPYCIASAARWGIRHEVTKRLAIGDHLSKHRPMPVSGFDQSDAGLIQPALYALGGLRNTQGFFKNPRIGRDANERIYNSPP